MSVKILTAREAMDLVPDGATVATGGFIGASFAEELALELENRFLETGHPRDLSLIFCAAQGDRKDKGLNHLAHDGMLKGAMGAHWGLAPKIGQMVEENKILAYVFPQGVMCHLLRDSAAHRPGTITHVGLGTFVDPRFGGGKINELTRSAPDRVHLMSLGGKDYLFYDYQKVDFALLCGTYADENGNISMEKCAVTGEMLATAQACKNSGGTVVVQVERVVKNGSLDPKKVEIPGILVDAVVPVSDMKYHMQTFDIDYDPSLSGEHRVNLKAAEPLPLTDKKIIARRAAMELRKGTVVNLGIGAPEFISNVAAEEGITNHFTLTVEAGITGGAPLGGLSFGTSRNPDCIMCQPSMFDFYQGGGLDQTYLGFAEGDGAGNVNVSKFGPKLPGCGGFIDISQNAKQVFFCGTFTAGGLKTHVEDGKLVIDQEGRIDKFLSSVEQVTFSAKTALDSGIPVMYFTERAVFRLTAEGLELIEIAPGIDLEKDVCAHMAVRPIIAKDLKLMDERIFRDELMGLK